MKCCDPSQQHDAHEFMRFLLSGMQDEVNLTPPKKEVTFHNPDSAWIYYRQSNISMIDDVLAGQLTSTVSCSFCRHVSTAYDPFLDLSFPIIPDKTKTLADCLAAFQTEEELDSYKCEKCKKEGKAKKRLAIQRFPKNLVINLKRFQTYPKKRKLKDQITYPVIDWRINK
jgi:ubiquitin carboxyl-terminal hydrolase 2/21